MTMHLLSLLPFAAAVFAAALPGQRMPIPDAGDRLLQLFDLRSLHAAGEDAAAADLATANMRGTAVAAMLRPLVEPALGPGDDLRPLGDRWLAVLGSPAQIACVERLFQLARTHRDEFVQIEVRFFELAAEPFHAHVEPELQRAGGKSRDNSDQGSSDQGSGDRHGGQVVLSKAEAPALLAAATQHGELLQMPSIVMPWLVPAEIEAFEQFPYIQDYQLTYGPQQAIADPIIGTLWSGHKSRVCAARLPDGGIALSCDIHHQQVDRPLAETEVTLVPGAAPVKVQLPRITGVHLESTAELLPGSMIVVSARRSDGRFVVAAITADVLQPR